jgi:hypothetical protein
MKGRATAEKCAVIHAHVASQQTIVRNDDVIADLTIVTDVRSGHQEIFITDVCGAVLGSAAMNGAVLGDALLSPISTFVLGRKRYILWWLHDRVPINLPWLLLQ